jgi:hypothetical protein
MIRVTFHAACDGCGLGFSQLLPDRQPLRAFTDRDALLVALGAARWGLVSGDTSDPAGWSVVCADCRGVGDAE